jgi:hypothetical protein
MPKPAMAPLGLIDRASVSVHPLSGGITSLRSRITPSR